MQYEINLDGMQAEIFKEKARVELKKRGVTYEDLAEELEYSEATVRKFFARGNWNRFLAASISDYLGLDGGKAWSELV